MYDVLPGHCLEEAALELPQPLDYEIIQYIDTLVVLLSPRVLWSRLWLWTQRPQNQLIMHLPSRQATRHGSA